MREFSSTAAKSSLAQFAVAEPAITTPPEAPLYAAPAAAPEPPRRSRRRIWVIAAAAVAIVLSAAFYFRSGRGDPSHALAAVRTAVAERRDLVRTLRMHGTVEATQAYLVAAPSLSGGGFSTLVITKLARAGAAVKKGDLLVEFDPQKELSNALDRRAEFRDLEEQINKKRADQAAARAKDETELKTAEDAMKSAELETQRNEVVSRIDAEKNQQNLEEARARLAQLKETFELKRRAARSEVRILEIQRDRARNAMQHAEGNAKKMSITSPLDGVVVLNTIWKGSNMGEVQEGDEVRTGVPFLQVMNPQAMQVRARVNQADFGLLRPSLPAQVRLDAYPDLTLPGRVERLAAIGATSFFSTKVRSFVVLFSLQGTAPRLMPDLSAAVEVELGRTPNTVVVPRDAVVMDHDAAFVFVKSGQDFRRKPVRVGAVSDVEAAIDSGLSAGDVVWRNHDSQKGGS
jgi:HlyD family secretion protein